MARSTTTIKCMVELTSTNDLKRVEAICKMYGIQWATKTTKAKYHPACPILIIRDILTYGSKSHCLENYSSINILSVNDLEKHHEQILGDILESYEPLDGSAHVPKIKYHSKSLFYPKITMILNQTN